MWVDHSVLRITQRSALTLYREPEGGTDGHGSVQRITFSGVSVARAGA
jgi:hypothetical protein